jgi:hypothetical protein
MASILRKGYFFSGFCAKLSFLEDKIQKIPLGDILGEFWENYGELWRIFLCLGYF